MTDYYSQYGALNAHMSKGALANSDAYLEHKFGRVSCTTSFVPMAWGGVFRTPVPASATTLRIKAGGNAADTAAGAGAREVTLVGLDETGATVTEAVATNGISASAATTATFMRLKRAYVSASGTYAAIGSYSHAAAITIENGAGGTDWATIDATDLGNAQSEICCYAVPLGKEAFLEQLHLWGDGAQTYDVRLLYRSNIMTAAAPFPALRSILTKEGIDASAPPMDWQGEGLYMPEHSELIVLVRTNAGTAVCSGALKIRLVPKPGSL